MLNLTFGCVKQSLQLGPISQSMVRNRTFLRKSDFGRIKGAHTVVLSIINMLPDKLVMAGIIVLIL